MATGWIPEVKEHTVAGALEEPTEHRNFVSLDREEN